MISGMLLKIFFVSSIFLFPFRIYAESVVLQSVECEKKLIELIEKSTNYIDISVYSINNERLVKAVIDAYHRGVKIRILTDKVQAAGKSSRIWEFIAENIPLRVHTHKRIMHTKVAIYDGVSVSSGSFNWTEPAVYKNEEVCDIFINEPDYAMQHQKLFDQRWADNSQEKSDLWLERKQRERERKRKEQEKTEK